MIMAKIKSGKLKDSCCLEKGKIKLLHLLRYLFKTEVDECNPAQHYSDSINVLCRMPLKIQALKHMVPEHEIL
jgi:hypothetical protein